MKKFSWLVVFTLVLCGAGKAQAMDNEFILGGGYWSSDLAKGNFAYGEDVLWIDGEYSPGIGIYGMIESGESKVSDYTWDGQLVGPQIGFKHTWASASDYHDAKNMPVWLERQWLVKLRYVWEKTNGENPTTGYWMKQSNTKLGLYAENVDELSPKLKLIITAEGWLTLSKERESSWSGDQPESRDQAAAGLYLQYKFAEPISVRAGLGPFYQAWDKMTGINVRGEVRLYEHVMVGAYVSFFPFGLSDTYTDLSTDLGTEVKESNLTTTGIFARIEF